MDVVFFSLLLHIYDGKKHTRQSAGELMRPQTRSVRGYTAAGTEIVILYNPILPKGLSLVSDMESFVRAPTSLFVFRRSARHRRTFSKLVHFSLLIIRRLNLDPSNLQNYRPVSRLPFPLGNPLNVPSMPLNSSLISRHLIP